jgi:hypothetical protein
VPERVAPDNAGAMLRQWLLEQELELYEHTMKPPPPAIDRRPPAQVDPAFQAELAAGMSGWWRTLADGEAYRLCRRDLPNDHPARRAGDLGDGLILTENDQLIEE